MTGTLPRLFIFLYTDEDITDRLAELLRERGDDAESALSAGTLGFSDERQLSFATDRGWTLLTCNCRDFMILAQRWENEGREHSGIILSPQFRNRHLGEMLRRVSTLIDNISAEEMRNTVRYLSG
jgi:Domain of unknown function (DUF5615)